MMQWYRITKYDPAFRDNGIYTRDEWTSISDVGKTYNGVPFSMDEYVKVESNYIACVKSIMRHLGVTAFAIRVLSRVMRKYNSVTYEVGSAKAEQAAGMFGLAAGQRAASCPSRVAKPLAKPLTGGWLSASYARSQQSAPCFSRSICSSDFMLM